MRMAIIGMLIIICMPITYKNITFYAKPQESQCGMNPNNGRILKLGVHAISVEIRHWVHLQGVYPVFGKNQIRIDYIDEISNAGHIRIKAASTFNYGDQWTSYDLPDSKYTNISNLQSFYDSGVSCVADSNVLYQPSYEEKGQYEVSRDGGRTWTKIAWKFMNLNDVSSGTTEIVATGTKHAGRMYLRVLEKRGNVIYVTDDYGKSFRFMSRDLIFVTESRASPTILYGIKYINGQSFLCKSNDSGNNWTDIEDGGIFSKNYYDPKIDAVIFDVLFKPTTQYRQYNLYPMLYQIETDPQNPDIFYVLAQNGLFKSADGGASFILLPLESDYIGQIDRIAVDPNMPERIYAGSRQKSIWMSDNGGCKWKELSLPDLYKWKEK
jgi:hypothetical protein